ncbi:hypothetical protein BT67DRAFT_84812 [Trichocladium antarcticum]|uniref:Uncharacterized protein n=1 Tax=Trichocladium antarcticum TaxID=1450529 RepID=A0AAN6UGD8_9PEZI|nr:hypothetical protein BT67DRAFT_84812 [Trichocladium antarcticum]
MRFEGQAKTAGLFGSSSAPDAPAKRRGSVNSICDYDAKAYWPRTASVCVYVYVVSTNLAVERGITSMGSGSTAAVPSISSQAWKPPGLRMTADAAGLGRVLENFERAGDQGVQGSIPDGEGAAFLASSRLAILRLILTRRRPGSGTTPRMRSHPGHRDPAWGDESGASGPAIRLQLRRHRSQAGMEPSAGPDFPFQEILRTEIHVVSNNIALPADPATAARPSAGPHRRIVRGGPGRLQCRGTQGATDDVSGCCCIANLSTSRH